MPRPEMPRRAPRTSQATMAAANDGISLNRISFSTNFKSCLDRGGKAGGAEACSSHVAGNDGRSQRRYKLESKLVLFPINAARIHVIKRRLYHEVARGNSRANDLAAV